MSPLIIDVCEQTSFYLLKPILRKLSNETLYVPLRYRMNTHPFCAGLESTKEKAEGTI